MKSPPRAHWSRWLPAALGTVALVAGLVVQRRELVGGSRQELLAALCVSVLVGAFVCACCAGLTRLCLDVVGLVGPGATKIQRNRTLMAAGLWTAIGGIVGLAGYVSWIRPETMQHDRWAVTSGVVLGFEPASHGSVRYRYQVESRWYERVDLAGVENEGARASGSSVRVYYDRGDPNQATLAPGWRVLNATWTVVAAALMVPTLVVGLLFVRRHSQPELPAR
jgi:hypothetical protein